MASAPASHNALDRYRTRAPEMLDFIGGVKMQRNVLRKPHWVGAAVAAAVLACMSPAQARVTRIVIDQTLNQPAIGGAQTVAYQTINGRAFGELCISGCAGAANNTIITDLESRTEGPERKPADARRDGRAVRVQLLDRKARGQQQHQRNPVARRTEPRRQDRHQCRGAGSGRCGSEQRLARGQRRRRRRSPHMRRTPLRSRPAS